MAFGFDKTHADVNLASDYPTLKKNVSNEENDSS